MTKHWSDELVNEEVRKIIKRLSTFEVGNKTYPGATMLYGKRIDLNNPRQVLVSAYWMGWADGLGSRFRSNND